MNLAVLETLPFVFVCVYFMLFSSCGVEQCFLMFRYCLISQFHCLLVVFHNLQLYCVSYPQTYLIEWLFYQTMFIAQRSTITV